MYVLDHNFIPLFCCLNRFIKTMESHTRVYDRQQTTGLGMRFHSASLLTWPARLFFHSAARRQPVTLERRLRRGQACLRQIVIELQRGGLHFQQGAGQIIRIIHFILMTIAAVRLFKIGMTIGTLILNMVLIKCQSRCHAMVERLFLFR